MPVLCDLLTALYLCEDLCLSDFFHRALVNYLRNTRVLAFAAGSLGKAAHHATFSLVRRWRLCGPIDRRLRLIRDTHRLVPVRASPSSKGQRDLPEEYTFRDESWR